MFRRTYDSLSMPVHLELLISEDNLCVKSWLEVSKEQYDHYVTPHNDWDYNTPGARQHIGDSTERSLTVPRGLDHLEFPGDVSGIYHDKLPRAMIYGNMITGEALTVAMPDCIKGDYAESMAGKYFVCNGYSWIDPTDPSINGGELSDAACWTIGVDYGTNGWNMPTGTTGTMHYVTSAYNTMAKSYNSKAHPLRDQRGTGAPVALMCYRPFTDTSFTDCSMTFKYNKGYGFSTNVTSGWEKGDGYNYLGHLAEGLPTFAVTSGGGSIDADGYDTVEFKMVDSDGATINHATDVYLEHTGGYIPLSRVSITNGTGSFKVGALGMSSGDTFKVKLGFRNYTGLTDINYTVA